MNSKCSICDESTGSVLRYCIQCANELCAELSSYNYADADIAIKRLKEKKQTSKG